MSNEFLDYIEDMIDAIEKIELLIQDISFEQFASDFRINYAVIRALEILGEAARRIPDSVRDQYNSIPWKSMVGMRDRIIHGYDTVDLKIVWETVIQDIPVIKPQILKILRDFER